MSASMGTGEQRPRFFEQLLLDERRHQFYSRALGWVMLLLLLACALLFVLAGGQPAPQHPECRAATGGAQPTVEAMRLELSSGPAQVRRLLRGADTIAYPVQPPHAQALCVEERVARHRELLGLDSSVFIPLYVLLGLSAFAWYYALALRSRGSDWARRGQVPRALVACLLVSAGVLAAAAVLDAAENRKAHRVLDEAVASESVEPSRAAVDALHRASVAKWAAVAAWAVTLALLAALRRRSLSLPRGSLRRRRWSAGLAWLLLGSALVAAVALGVGAALAGGASAEATDDRARCLVGTGFVAVFVHAWLLFALHRLHLPRRMVLPAPPSGSTHTERAIVSPEPL